MKTLHDPYLCSCLEHATVYLSGEDKEGTSDSSIGAGLRKYLDDEAKEYRRQNTLRDERERYAYPNHVQLKFHINELLYDIASLAFLQADVTPELEAENARHQLFDIVQEMGLERSVRVMNLAFQECAVLLSKISNERIAYRTTLDNTYGAPPTYILELRFRDNTNRHVVWYIKDLIHEFIVVSVVADRIQLLFPELAAQWEVRKDQLMGKIKDALPNILGRTLKRPLSPF